MFTNLRETLCRCGLAAGDLGDNTIPGGVGLPSGYVHYFTLEEFSAELARTFGQGHVAVTRAHSKIGPLLVGVVSKDPADDAW